MVIQLSLTFKCPRCGSNLVMREYSKHVQVYCPNCMLSITVSKRLMLTRHVDYDNRRFDWVRALEFLYELIQEKATYSS